MALDVEFKAKWLEALRSGKYDQATCTLFDGRAYCCLGVGCVVAGSPIPRNVKSDRVKALASLGLRYREQETLARLNDGGESFYKIADHIEANL